MVFGGAGSLRINVKLARKLAMHLLIGVIGQLR